VPMVYYLVDSIKEKSKAVKKRSRIIALFR
jgi:hypothetical protein